MMDTVRVIRILEYTGSRKAVEDMLCRSYHGTVVLTEDVTLRAATIGTYPEIIEVNGANDKQTDDEADSDA